MAAAHHLLAVEDGIAVVTLNRPEALNSPNRALRMELMELFPALDMRKDVKVILITGAGDKAFCTGADLKERSAKSILEGRFPERIVEKAVERMLPRGPLGRVQLGNLRVYPGAEHPHEAQKPEKLDVAAMNRKNVRSA